MGTNFTNQYKYANSRTNSQRHRAAGMEQTAADHKWAVQRRNRRAGAGNSTAPGRDRKSKYVACRYLETTYQAGFVRRHRCKRITVDATGEEIDRVANNC